MDLPPPPSITTDADLRAAQQARLGAQAEFFRAVDDGLEVRKTADRMRERRIRNGFGDLLTESMRMGKGKA